MIHNGKGADGEPFPKGETQRTPFIVAAARRFARGRHRSRRFDRAQGQSRQSREADRSRGEKKERRGIEDVGDWRRGGLGVLALAAAVQQPADGDVDAPGGGQAAVSPSRGGAVAGGALARSLCKSCSDGTDPISLES